MAGDEFFTFREYMKKEEDCLTASMEDYLEMIYRLCQDQGFTRVHDLAAALNVQPPSATKMVQKLAEALWVKYEKYGIIVLTDKGRETGRFLLRRHNTIERFLRLIGLPEEVLQETEKMEHTVGEKTLVCLTDFVEFLRTRPDIMSDYEQFRREKQSS
ncbi:iron-dependent transcriptional repressor [Heliomicrobium modesticaldum Ice1]|uniref:Manganese transport regulator n=1 Tax=Heliobacterium modesticaldum (strain ATCC 51547 / Ice1) TaxID=498761 RepID=B0TEL3_HELMI|nr:transcriptional regulator MntR [Heliomicrobium modesticaldum]ABZ82932.1 iron-dependent transcriptional repressor [Heliomicrobium modesticaldum Ice1]